MKKINYIVLCLLIINTSCKKSYFDINTNPNTPTSASVDLVLPAALNSTAATVSSGLDFSNFWMGFWSVSGGYAPDVVSTTYKFSNTYYQGIWSSLYYSINNYNYVEQAALSTKSNFYAGIAKIMKAYCYHNLVDIYGNVPYSQALQIGTYPRPAYDNASAIYGSLFKQIDSAKVLISNWGGDVPASTSDIMFSGSSKQWLRFANTLELRMLLRLSQMSSKPAYFTTELAALKADPNGFLGVGQGALVNPGYSNASDANLNPFYASYGYSAAGNVSTNYGFYRANTYAVNFYQFTSDPRIGKFFAPYSGSNFAGNDYGVQGQPNNVVSGIGYGLINSPSQSAPILTSFESLFLQAEAVNRGLLTGDYKALYKLAVSESFAYFGLSNTDAQTYYSQLGTASLQDKVNIDLSSNPLTTIMTQKWASMNVINPLETYADWRRVKIPDVPGSKASGAGQIPVRLYYPLSDVQTNPDNVSAQGTITLSTKIFWMP